VEASNGGGHRLSSEALTSALSSDKGEADFYRIREFLGIEKLKTSSPLSK
jgi:hypothetical protein